MTRLEICKELIEAGVREPVYNNALRVLGTLSKKQENEITEIYKSKFGTLIIEWYLDYDNEFSLEISTQDCGYYSYLNGKVKHIVDSGGEKTLKQDLKEWINELLHR